MKVEPETQSANKVDMSLDDIIKLDKRQAWSNRMATNRARGKRGVRVAASGIRLRSLRQKRLSRPVGQIQASRPLTSPRSQRFMNNRAPRNNRSVALAVLRRARQTAAAAARTAADAVALLQRGRIQRQRVFDERRGIQSTATSAPSISQRRRGRGNAIRSGFRTTKRGNRTNALGSRIGVRRAANVLRNRRQRSINNRAGRRPRFTTRNSTVIPAFIPVASNNGFSAPRVSFASGQRGNRGNSQFSPRGRGRRTFSFPERFTPTGNTARGGRNGGFNRNAEYLAQARALIQAQNEASQTYSSQNSRAGRWNASRRRFNYYAQYWDN